MSKQQEQPPTKRQVARSNRAGSTTIHRNDLLDNFAKTLKRKGLPEWQETQAFFALIQALSDCDEIDPPPAEKATNSAHQLPTDGAAAFWREECRKRAELLSRLEWSGNGRSMAAAIRDEPLYEQCPKCHAEKPRDSEGRDDYENTHAVWGCELAALIPMPKEPAATDSAHELPTGMTDERLADIKALLTAQTPRFDDPDERRYVEDLLRGKHELLAEVDRLRAALADRTKETA